MRRKLTRSASIFLILCATILLLASCDWNGDILLGDEETDSGEEETEGPDEPTDGGDTATATENSEETDSWSDAPDSNGDSDNHLDDSEHSDDGNALTVGVVMPNPREVEKWDDAPSELCVFIFLSGSLWGPNLSDLSDTVAFQCIDEIGIEYLSEKIDTSKEQHYMFEFSAESLEDAGDFIDVVAAIYMDGDHKTDSLQPYEDYLGVVPRWPTPQSEYSFRDSVIVYATEEYEPH